MMKPSYLCFEGGGAKSLAYIGAIRALENVGILPPPGAFPPPMSRYIQGISGASAGAMMAFLVALGYNSQMLYTFFDDQKFSVDILDNIEDGNFVRVKYGHGTQFYKPYRGPISINPLNLLGRLGIQSLQKIFGQFARGHLSSMGRLYINSIFLDSGIVVGGGLRKVLFRALKHFIRSKPGSLETLKKTSIKNMRGYSTEHDISFAGLKELTGISLVVPTTNLSKQRSVVFSDTLTPGFPVIEAVAMSSSHPLLFKPTIVENVGIYRASDINLREDIYNGLHIDGGARLNFPLHVFDAGGSLNPKVLGLRLTEGGPGYKGDELSAEGPSLLGPCALALIATLAAGGEADQIRSEAEREQTVDIFTGYLSTFDVTRRASEADEFIDNAEKQVLAWLKRNIT
jgi:predicted acylesterase/phospholipase RssA